MEQHASNLAAWMLPIFTAGMILEWWSSRGDDKYHVSTALSDLGTGGVFQGLELILHFALIPAYAWLYDHARWVTWQQVDWKVWTLALIGVDLLFYAWHRVSHVVHAMWAVHGVHHQSEEFNLAVALRQPAFEPITWFPFTAVLALMGVPLYVYLWAYGLNRFYQFWVHTELVDRLGPLEWVLNTPSHHRVHHAVQPQYLDKNYGGVLILWDRLFGTFAQEQERPLYGTTIPLRSVNPVWANFGIFADIVSSARSARGLREIFKAWWGHPAWRPDEAPSYAGIKRTDPEYRKYRPTPDRPTLLYVGAHFVLLASLTSPLMKAEPHLSWVGVVLGSGAMVLGQLSICALVERKTWALPVEVARWGLTAVAAGFILKSLQAPLPALWAVACVATLGFASQLWLWRRA